MKNHRTRKIWCKVCQDGSHAALTHKIVAARFERQGFILLSETYTNDQEPLDYICKCGEHDSMPFQRFRSGGAGCKDCAEKQRKENCIEKYGVDHPQKSEEVRKKTKETCIERYGVDNPFKDPDVVQKIKDVHMDRYGVDNPMYVPEFAEKQRQTMQDHYGVDNPMQNPEIKEKAAQTCMERYGVRNPMQNEEIYRKARTNMWKKKEYELPSGRIVELQGYEHFALDILLKMYDEDQIVADDRNKDGGVPTITFDFKGQKCKFYPDFYIPHKNKIIEVKSTFTYEQDIERNAAKILSTSQQGYKIEYWFFEDDGEFSQIISLER